MSDVPVQDDDPVARPAGRAGGLMVLLGGLMTLAALLWITDAARMVGILLFQEQFSVFVFGIALAMAFLGTRARKHTASGKVPWYDMALALLGFAVCTYVAVDFQRLSVILSSKPTEALVASSIILLLSLEALRRTVGYTLVVLSLVFIVYALIADRLPDPFSAPPIRLDRLILYLALDANALLGLPMMIGTTVVLAYVFFGELLTKSGGAGFFTDLAIAAMGRRRGGGAKVAVIASALFGTISGSAVSNVVSTGVVSIPLMKRTGFKPATAGGVEAVASTGGQLMPPIMGAAAFLMAEFLQLPYRDIILASLIPAILYYLAIYVQVDLIAGRGSYGMVAEPDLPSAGPTLRAGWHFALPFAAMLFALFAYNMEAELAALVAAAIVILFGMLRGYKGSRLSVGNAIRALPNTGISMVELVLIVAAAGYVIGILNLTGLGFSLSHAMIQLAGGSLVALLLMAAAVCIVLGMGMPTTGVYLLLATLVAPAIVQLGVPALAAHMFIFYYGMMSMITPPVAMASFAAATLSGARFVETSWESMKLGWVAYAVPFLIVVSPSLLMIGDPLTVIWACITAIIGVILVSAALAGYLIRPASPPVRVLLLIAGLLAVIPADAFPGAILTDFVGIALGAAIFGREWLAAGRSLRLRAG